MAGDLGIPVKTVHNHLNAAYQRLGTQTLVHTVLFAVRRGIVRL
ncbi:MAG: hypothetical protein GY929_13065 [Actinomycetia bacterium]|nr:hypothetical protein [Actinomycetes bacterium]